MNRNKYINALDFLNHVDALNNKFTPEDKRKNDNMDMVVMIKRFVKWYKDKNPKASERQITRAVNNKFWSEK